MAVSEDPTEGRSPASGRARHRGLVLAAGLALVLAACAPVTPKICPRVAVLDDASSLTRLAPGGALTDEVVVFAEMVGVESECIYRGELRHELESTFSMEIVAQRGPALRGDSAEVEYFVVITNRAGTVLNKRVFPLRIEFAGADTVRLKEHTWQYYRLESGTTGSSYEIWAGFQLSDTELEFNRASRAR